MLKTYKYNSKLVQTTKCNYIHWPEDRGYEALNGVMTVKERENVAAVLASDYEYSNIEERKLRYLQKFINDCKSNNIKLLMCYSPYYGQAVPKSIHVIEELATKNEVTFLNYGDDKRFQKLEYFQDASHLNNVGAQEYTKEVAMNLKNIKRL